jgi:hypothetical protein
MLSYIVLSKLVDRCKLDVARDTEVVLNSEVVIKLYSFREIFWWETDIADIMISRIVDMLQPGEKRFKANFAACAVELF